MIQRLKIKNIQSHKENEFEFSQGINAIVGSSNNGKTAILRAISWIKDNRPLGIDTLASHWIVDDKGNLTDEIIAEIVTDSGKITRRRTKDKNQYIINDKVLNVVKYDVPQEVEKTLKLTSTNVQKQLDSPFLLSESNGEIAKYFNKIVHLDIIDKILGNAESIRRKTNQEIIHNEQEIEQLEKKVNNFDFLDVAKKLSSRIAILNSENKEFSDNSKEIINSMNKYDEYVKKIINLDEQKNIISEIESNLRKSEVICSDKDELKKHIDQVEEFKLYDFDEEKNIISKIEYYNSLNVEISDTMFSIQNNIEIIQQCYKNISSHEEEINKLTSQLPNICPICGNVMKRSCL